MKQTNDIEYKSSFDEGPKEGLDYIVENGYRVMTEHFLKNRGYCCGNG